LKKNFKTETYICDTEKLLLIMPKAFENEADHSSFSIYPCSEGSACTFH